MKRILAFTILAGLALAQPPTQSQVGRGQMAAPSTSVKTDLPAQTVTITINLSADQVTALEKQRRDNFSAVVDPTTGATILQPVNPDVASQLKADLGPLFAQLLTRYPSASLQAAQKSASDAQKALQDATKAAGQVQHF